MMVEEFVAIVNDKDEFLIRKERKQVHIDGDLHREVYAFIVNEAGEILLTQASDTHLWDCSAAGHFSWAETYEQGIIREIKEELGIEVAEVDLEEIFKIKNLNKGTNKVNYKFIKLFEVQKDVPIDTIKIQREEIEAVKYISKAQLTESVNRHPELYEERFRIAYKEYLIRRP